MSSPRGDRHSFDRRSRFPGREVFIERRGDAVILRPKPAEWADFFSREHAVPDGFLADRVELEPEDREPF